MTYPPPIMYHCAPLHHVPLCPPPPLIFDLSSSLQIDWMSSESYSYVFCLFVFLSLCLFVSLSLCLFVFFVSLSLCLFVSLSLCLFVSLSLCLFVLHSSTYSSSEFIGGRPSSSKVILCLSGCWRAISGENDLRC